MTAAAPTPEILKNTLPRPRTAAEFDERVRCLCALYDCSITSWMRTDHRNASVGGVPNSYHRVGRGGLGADLVPDDPAQKPFLVRAGRKLGLTMLDEGDHVHAEPSGP